MSDGDSVSGALKDLGREAVKQIASIPKSLLTGAANQVTKPDSEEKEAEKIAEKAATHARIQQIEAEMAAIRAQNEKKTGPEIVSEREKMEEMQNQQQKPQLDEASRQAIGKAEQGRNFKG